MSSISTSSVIDAMFLIAPQFYTDDPTILASYEALAGLVSCQINPQILACCGTLVFAFLLAHYLTLQVNPTLGMVANLHEGDLSVGFNVNPDINALNLTPYGRSYMDLVKRTVVGSTVTNLPLMLGGVAQFIPTWGCGCDYGYGFGNAGGQGGGCGC